MKTKLKPAEVDLLALILRLTALNERIDAAHKEHIQPRLPVYAGTTRKEPNPA